MSVHTAVRIVVTGAGTVGPLGCGTETVWSRLLAGQSGIRALPADLAARHQIGTLSNPVQAET